MEEGDVTRPRAPSRSPELHLGGGSLTGIHESEARDGEDDGLPEAQIFHATCGQEAMQLRVIDCNTTNRVIDNERMRDY